MAVFQRCNYIVEELYIEPMEKTVRVTLVRGNYRDKFVQEPRRENRPMNIYFNQEETHRNSSSSK